MLASLLLFAPLASVAEDWVEIVPPALCAHPVATIVPPILLSGSHLDSARGEVRAALDPSRPALPFATFLQIVEEDARARGGRLDIQRQGSSALVRGDAASLAGATALQNAFDKAGRALDIEVTVRIVPKKPAAGDEPLTFHRRLCSGDVAFFGTRTAQSYVSGFDVEVAAQSGSSDPIVGRALAGRGLHLVACRVAGGERVFVWGVFDVADVVEVLEFDPGTPDLGVLQEPRIVSAQATFSGTIDGKTPLVVELRGTPLATADWTLEIQAQTTPDSALDAGAKDGFALVDLNFCSVELPQIAPADPGTLVRGPARARVLEASSSALPPAAVAALVESGRGSGGSMSRNSRAQLYWSDRVLLVPRSDPAAIAEARALVRGLEAARLGELRVEFGMGALGATLPACKAAPARFVTGSERPLLVEYRLEVAPQIWMPAPIVESLFDGACFDAAVNRGGVDTSLWTSASGPVVEVTRENAQVGKLQLATRSLKSGTARVDLGANARLDISGKDEGAASVRCEPR